MPTRPNPNKLFSVYSKLDEEVLKICIAHHCFLIGGTTLEILMNYNNLKFSRKRSDNDFDFVMRISNSPHIKMIDRELCYLRDFTKTGDDRIMVNFNSDLVAVEEVSRLEKLLSKVNSFEEDAERKLLELVENYNLKDLM